LRFGQKISGKEKRRSRPFVSVRKRTNGGKTFCGCYAFEIIKITKKSFWAAVRAGKGYITA